MSTINTVLQNKSESNGHLNDEPLGQKTNAIRWLQKQVMRKSAALPRDFSSKEEWETFRRRMRGDLPGVIGIPEFPPLEDSHVRACLDVGEDTVLERVDVYLLVTVGLSSVWCSCGWWMGAVKYHWSRDSLRLSVRRQRGGGDYRR